MALITERWRRGVPDAARVTRWDSAPVLLTGLGAFALVLYVITLLIPFSVFEFGDTPILNMAEATGRTRAGIARFLVTFGAPFIPYLLGLLLLTRRRVPLLLVAAFPVIAGLVLLLVYPLTATDVFLYGGQVRVFTEHGANPYTTPLTAFPGDPLLGRADFDDQPTAYGPVWTYIAMVPTLIGGDEPMRVALGMKALVLSALVVTVLLSYRVAEDLKPGSGTLAAFLLGWNPIVLWSVAGDGHNDIVMMAPVLLAFYFLPRRTFLALPALAAGVLVKFSALVFVPVFVVYLWRRGYDRALLAGSIIAATALGMALLAPFWEGLDTIHALIGQVREMASMSPGAMLTFLGQRLGLSPDVADAMAQTAVYQAFAFLYLLLLIKVKGQPGSLARAAFWAMFLLIFLGTLWFRFWYILWLMPLAAIIVGVDRRLAITGIIFSGTAIFVYAFTDYTWVWLGLDFGFRTHVPLMLTVFLPPLLYLAASYTLSALRSSRADAARQARPVQS